MNNHRKAVLLEKLAAKGKLLKAFVEGSIKRKPQRLIESRPVQKLKPKGRSAKEIQVDISNILRRDQKAGKIPPLRYNPGYFTRKKVGN